MAERENRLGIGRPRPPKGHPRPPLPDRELPPYIYLAEAYVPVQDYGERFSPEEALERGSLWPALWQPYERPFK